MVRADERDSAGFINSAFASSGRRGAVAPLLRCSAPTEIAGVLSAGTPADALCSRPLSRTQAPRITVVVIEPADRVRGDHPGVAVGSHPGVGGASLAIGVHGPYWKQVLPGSPRWPELRGVPPAKVLPERGW